MAKTKTSKATKKTQKTTFKPTAILRKGALAYVGLHGTAFERVQMRFTQLRCTTDSVFNTLVEKGTEIEVIATGLVSNTTTKVINMIPSPSKDRAEQLENEVAKLNKKITALSKRAAKPISIPTKTDKTISTGLTTSVPKAA